MKPKDLISYGLLAAIVAIAFFLRIYKVDKIPPSLSWDEVSIGYNAYSILKTGRDEHGQFLPLAAFAAYGDYKPPLAIYLTVPAVAIFGLGDFAVRLPSIILGSLTVLVLFFLVRQLLPRVPPIAWFATLALAVSPWHVNLSRAGFEANIALFFLVLGFCLVLAARRRPKLLIFCWLPIVLAIYTFNSARYFAPFLSAGLLIYIWKNVKENKSQLLAGLVLATILMLPILPFLFSKEARLRFNEVNIFTDASIVTASNEKIDFDGNTWWSKIFHNRRIGYAKSYLIHFFDNLEPGFLFGRGDGNPKFSIRDVGQLYLIDLPFVILGIYWIFLKETSVGWLLVFWLVSAIIPAATARETPHALRIENGLPVFMIFTAAGLTNFYSQWITKNKGKILLGFTALLFLGNILFYLHNYYIHYPREYSGEWQYGYREALAYVGPLQNDYDQIVMTDSIGRPYMYVLFYEKVDPAYFRRSVDATFDAAGFYNVYGFGKFRFVRGAVGKIDKKTLYILDPSNIPTQVRVLKTIDLLNDQPALVIFDIP